MFTFLIAAWGNTWVRRIALGVGVVIVLLAVRQQYIDLGKAKRDQAARQDSSQLISNAPPTVHHCRRRAAYRPSSQDLASNPAFHFDVFRRRNWSGTISCKFVGTKLTSKLS